MSVLNRFGKLFRWSALALVFLLPFERIPSVDVIGVTFRLSTLLLILVAVAGGARWLQGNRTVHFTPVDRAILGYGAAVLVADVAGVNLVRSITLTTFLALTLVGYWLISRYLTDATLANRAKNALYATTALTVLFGLYQFGADSFFHLGSQWTLLSENYVHTILGFARVQSTALEPLYFANFLLLPFFLLTSDLAQPVPKQVSWWKSLLLFLVSAALVLTVSRGAYIATVAGLLLFLILALVNRLNWWAVLRPALVIGVGVLAAISAISLIPPDTTQVHGTAQNTFLTHAVGGAATRDAGVAPRLATYKSAYHIFRSSPLVGVGLGNFALLTDQGKTATNQYPIVNNMYLEALAETGVIGAVALGIIVIVLIRLLWRNRRVSPGEPFPTLALLPMLTALLVQYNFFSTIYILFVWVVIGIIASRPVRAHV